MKIRTHKVQSCAALLLCASLGCGGKTRVRTPHVVKWEDKNTTGPVSSWEQDASFSARTVTHPPPAALPEIVPDPPDDTAVWIDGYWRWETTQWVWLRGGWAHMQQGDRMFPARFWFTPEGAMRFTDRYFRDGRDQQLPRPKIITPAASPPISRLAEDSTLP